MYKLIMVLIFIFTSSLVSKELVLSDEEKNFISQNPYIKVSNEFDWYPYDFNDKGNATGYAVDYFKLLASKIGLHIQFVTDDWATLSKKFETKEIDILYPAKKSKKREKIALFGKEFIKMQLALITKSARSDIESFEDMDGKTLALIKGWASAKYIKNRYKNIKYIEFDTSKETLESVAFGLADGAIEDIFSANYIIKKEMYSNLHIVSKVNMYGKDSYSLHLMFQKDNPLLQKLFDKAIDTITPDDILKLKSKWIGDFILKNKKLEFTSEENVYLQNKKIVKYCIDPNWIPLEMNKDGVHIGISSDYMKLLRKKIDVHFKFVETKTWAQTLEFVKNRKCDILTLAMESLERKSYLDFTKPYIDIPLVLVAKNDEIFYSDVSSIKNLPIGITKDYTYGEVLRVRYPNMNLIDVENINDGLNKVESGELFGYIDAVTAAGYAIQNRYFSTLKIAGKFDKKWGLGVAVRNDEPILLHIFEKAIESIDVTKHQEILNKWISVKYDTKADYSNIFKFLALVFVIAILILYRQYHLKKLNKKLEILSTTDKLTSIYNRLKLDEVMLYEKNIFDRFYRPLSIVLLDIDDFKKINDKYGHKVGDEVLQSMAKILLDTKRKTDILGRWGGEEFLVICHETDLSGAMKLAEKFRTSINSSRFANIEHLSASFGVAEFAKDESIENIFIRADQGLYKAKESGKNRVEAY